MACADTTPWSVTAHPNPLIRMRPTGGGSSQSTGKWTPESTTDTVICGALRQLSSSKPEEELVALDGAQFVRGQMKFICNKDCDVAVNDILAVYEDEAGTDISYWRVSEQLLTTRVYNNINNRQMTYWVITREERS